MRRSTGTPLGLALPFSYVRPLHRGPPARTGEEMAMKPAGENRSSLRESRQFRLNGAKEKKARPGNQWVTGGINAGIE
jgi:hypothetical protein